jgi:hypothetical protein
VHLGKVDAHHADPEPRVGLLAQAVRTGRDLDRLLRQLETAGVVAMAAPQRAERAEQPGLCLAIAGRPSQAKRRLQVLTGRLELAE